MLKAAADWVYGIAAVLLLGAVALQAVPDGAYRKYVRLFLGGIMILAVVSPIFSALGLSQKTALYYQRDTLSTYLGNLGWQEAEKEQWQDEALEHMESSMEGPLSTLTESYGFALLSYSIEWGGNGEQVEGIVLTVREKEASGREADPADGKAEASAGEAGETDGAAVRQVEKVQAVEPVGEETGSAGTESGSNGSGGGEAGPADPYYEPSELRALHEALETVLELTEKQVVIYLQREGAR